MSGRRSPRAFTLIELLAASALASVLVLVLFQVIGSLGRTRAALDRKAAADSTTSAHEPWKSDLLDMLRWDLANATERKLEPGRVTLVGHGSLDRRTLAAGHEPAAVIYELERRGGRSLLVRRQVDAGAWTEVLCADATGFALQPLRPIRGGIGAPALRIDAPLRVRVEGTRETLLDEVIVVP